MQEQPLSQHGDDVKALARAFEAFTQSTQALEETYRLLEARARELGEKLAAKNRELELTNDYLNNLLESMSDGVVAVDTRGVITKYNRAAEVILGYPAAECVGRLFRDLFGRDFTPLPGESGMYLRARNGDLISITERNAPLAGKDNPCIGYVKVFQDLTEIEALRQRVRRLDRLAAVGEMAATVAHEIRNPLGGVRGFAALLARDIDADDPRSRLVEKILVGVGNLDRVVSELLEYTRPVELNPRPVACYDIVDTAMAYAAPDAGVRLCNNVPRGINVMADPERMVQVLLNMLLNAIQSMGGGAGEVAVDATAEGAAVDIRVADTGCGIAPEHLGRVFSPFFSTKEKGSGLGLAVAAKIVEGHVGTITVSSAPGRGSTFVIRLPRAE